MPPPPYPVEHYRPRVHIHLSHGLSLAAWEKKRGLRLVREDTPYGYGLANEWFDIGWSRDASENVLTKFVRRALRKTFGFDFLHAWRNRRALRAADVVWTHTEVEHLAVALVRVLTRRPRFLILAQSVWLWDRWDSFSFLRRAAYTRLLHESAIEIVLSDVNHQYAAANDPRRTVARVPFGTQFDDSGPVPCAQRVDQPPRVVAAGNDRDRDWELLAAVAASLPNVQFDIFSQSEGARRAEWPANATLRSDADVEEVTAAYRAAELVAIPLRSNRHASGITVAIEAMAAGVPVVATAVGGIDAYILGDGCFLVGEGDTSQFSAAVELAITLSADGALRSSLAARVRERGLTQREYIWRLVWLTRFELGHSDLPHEVLQFRAVPRPTPFA